MPQTPTGMDDETSESLGDYLGHLLSSVTKARMQADLETIRIAEQYQSHPLLKHFPVPRVRLPKVELNVPVIMVGTLTPDSEEDADKEAEESTPSIKHLASQVVEAFGDILEELGGNDLSDAVKAKITPEVQTIVDKIYGERGSASPTLKRTRTTAEDGEKSSRVPRLKNSLSALTDKTVTGARYLVSHFYRIKLVQSQIRHQKLENNIQATLKKTFLSEVNNLMLNLKQANASNIVIQAQTSKVRESSHEHLAMFKLTVTEDSVEWTLNDHENDETEPDEILVPE